MKSYGITILKEMMDMRRKMMMVMAASFAAITAMAGNYKVNASIAGIPDGTKMVLLPLSHEPEKPIAEAEIKAGKVSFFGSVSEPMCVLMMVKDSYGTIQLMLDNETVEVSAHATNNRADDTTPNYIYKDVKVIGSPLTDKLYSLKSIRDSMDVIYQANDKRFAEISAKLSKAYGAKDTTLIAQLKKSEEYKAKEKADHDFFKTIDEKYTRLFITNKDSFWGPLMMIELMSYLTPDQRGIYEQFSDAAKNSYYGKKVKNELYPVGNIGQAVPNFTVKDEQGKTHTLKSLLQGKKYLVLDFWASWCAPCRREIPNVKNQYALYKEKGLEVVSISIDKNAAAWKKAVKEENLLWPNFLSPEVANEYKVRAVPTMYLLDAEGKVVAENDEARGEKLAAKLKELFGK